MTAVKSIDQLEQELSDTRRHGMRLWRRAEEWKRALEKIRAQSDDPGIAEIASKALGYQHI